MSLPSLRRPAIGSAEHFTSGLRLCFVVNVGLVLLIAIAGCSKSDSSPDGTKSTAENDEISSAERSNPDPGLGLEAAPDRDDSSLGAFAPPVGQPAPKIASSLELPGDADEEALVGFLQKVDGEIQRVSTLQIGPQYRDPLVAELKRLAIMKGAAADRLLDSGSLDEAQLVSVTRSKMQSFSHQAALGDLKAAEALEDYAVSLANSAAPEIARDSRTVLVSFALERLQSGVTDQPDEVVRLVKQLASNTDVLDASSVLSMRQAMKVLGQYGYTEAAEEARGVIERTFVNTTDPELSELVADVLASARFNMLESMRSAILQSKTDDPEQWRAEAEKVAKEKADVMTMQYLVSLALQLEAMEMLESAAAVYGPIDEYFAKSDNFQIAEPAGEAVAAFTARKEIIGQPFPIGVNTTLDGQPLDLSRFENQIVLMPYWAVEQLDSLGPIQGLQQIAAQNPERVKILGVNLDISPAGQKQAMDLAATRLDFPNVAAIAALPDNGTGASEDPYISPLVKRVGIVSVPAVVVLDQQGNVAAVALGPDRVERAVQELLQP